MSSVDIRNKANWYPVERTTPYSAKIFGLKYKNVPIKRNFKPLSYLYRIATHCTTRTINPIRVIGVTYRKSLKTYDMLAIIQYANSHSAYRGNKHFQISKTIPEVYKLKVGGDWLPKAINSTYVDLMPPEMKSDSSYISVEGEDGIVCLMDDSCNFNDDASWDMINDMIDNPVSVEHLVSRAKQIITLERQEDQRSHIKSFDRVPVIRLPDRYARRLPVYVNLSHEDFTFICDEENTTKTISDNDLTKRPNLLLTTNILEWSRTDIPRIIYGPPGMGKTSVAKYLLNYRCIIVYKEEDLLRYDGSIHDGIIFENVMFSELDHLVMSLLLVPINRIIRTSSGDIFIPKSTKLIFTTSMHRGSIFGESPDLEPVYERCTFLRLNRSVYTDNDELARSRVHTVAF